MTAILQHYERTDLLKRLQSALAAAGLADKRLTSHDLAPIDHFHSRGLLATVELAKTLPLGPATKVLDVGSGLGGPARYLAATYGSHVQGIDLTPSYVAAAQFLTERSGLSDLVTFACADALALPFPDASFDLVWTQHVAMNIADKSALYAETLRVLRPGGRFALYDIVAGTHSPIHFPVPWATAPAASFLLTADELRATLLAHGFNVLSWTDHTPAAIIWFSEMQKAQQAATVPPPLGLHVVVGPEFQLAVATLSRNLQEGRVALLEGVLQRA